MPEPPRGFLRSARAPRSSGNDGADLAAAIATIREIGDAEGLNAAVADALPGSRLHVDIQSGRFALAMEQHGLLTPRPPQLMVLNEPETSLHADLLAPLARLISEAARHTQILVVTHAALLISALGRQQGLNCITLEKAVGETSIARAKPLELPPWHWPSR